MRSEAERLYAFDTLGYYTVQDAIGEDHRQELLDDWDEVTKFQPANDIIPWRNQAWKRVFTEVLQREDNLLQTILGPGYRVDHVFGMTEKYYSTKEHLHHHSRLDDGILYSCHQGRPFTTLATLSIALLEIPPGRGGFCCIPGSHNSNVKPPGSIWKITEDNDLVQQIPQPAGSSLLFTEALTHGTYPFYHGAGRRSILIRLVPKSFNYRREPQADHRIRIPHLYTRNENIEPTPPLQNPYLRQLFTDHSGK